MPQLARSARRRVTPVRSRRSARGYGAQAQDLVALWLPPAIAATAFVVLYVLGNLDVIDTPPALAIDAFLLVCIVLYFPMRYVRRLDARGRALAMLLAAAWVAIVDDPIYTRIYPGERIATIDATPADLPLTLPTRGRGERLDMVIDGHLDEAQPGATRVARYSITVVADGRAPQSFQGEFKESWLRQRQSRQGAVEVLREHKATSVQLDNPLDSDLRVTELAVQGQASHVLTLSLYPHRMPPWWVAGLLGAGLLVAAVIYDRRTGAGDTAASLVIATGAALTGAFAFPGIGSPHPTFRELVGAAIVGALVGGPIGGLVAWSFKCRSRAGGRSEPHAP